MPHASLTAMIPFLSAGLIASAAIASPQPGSDGETQVQPPGVPAGVEVAREENPDVSDAELARLVAGNNAFAFDLYHQIRTEADNLFYSPHSISMAMAMAYGGARGQTEEEMREVLQYGLGQADTHPAMNALDLALAARAEQTGGEENTPFELHVVNNLFGQTGYSFESDYLSLLARHYGAGLRLLDFGADPDRARTSINDWVETVTSDRIQDLLPGGSITPLTRLVLTNAIYFNAAWEYPFPEDRTDTGTFQHLDGSTAQVEMMHNRARYGYATTPNAQLVELPYVDEKLSMVVVLPDRGAFETVEDTLDGPRVAGMLEDLERRDIRLSFPKFGYRSDVRLEQHLTRLGMLQAFDPEAADFSGMNGGTEPLFIQGVFHQAWVDVDEEGTEAAAATGVVVGTTSIPPRVTVDRPFVYLIRNVETGAILFVGRVLDPTA